MSRTHIQSLLVEWAIWQRFNDSLAKLGYGKNILDLSNTMAPTFYESDQNLAAVANAVRQLNGVLYTVIIERYYKKQSHIMARKAMGLTRYRYEQLLAEAEDKVFRGIGG